MNRGKWQQVILTETIDISITFDKCSRIWITASLRREMRTCESLLFVSYMHFVSFLFVLMVPAGASAFTSVQDDGLHSLALLVRQAHPEAGAWANQVSHVRCPRPFAETAVADTLAAGAAAAQATGDGTTALVQRLV